MHRLLTGLRLALFTLLCATAIFAQRDLATIVGTVTDVSGGVIANAKVTVTEVETGQVYVLTTSGVGEFVRPALKPSTYTVAVTAPGFRTAEEKNILLKAGERTGVNITLAIGDVGQTVEVSAAAPLLQTESTQVGASVNSKTMTDAPLGGQRNFAYLARMSPGVLPAEPGARDAANGGFSAGGVRGNGQNNFLLNGVDNNVNTIDFLNQTSYAVGPSVEAISEMSIQTNGFNAEYGRAAGAVINVNLKSGSNQLHGSLFQILQNKDLNANTWTNNQANKPRGPFIQNQFGATAGGPIKRNKLFIFGDYQGTRITASGGLQGLGFSSATATVPTADMKSGNFASILGAAATGTDANGNPISFLKGQIYDPMSTTGTGNAPVSRTPFVGNIIPPSRIVDNSFRQLLQLFPSPNQTVITGNQPSNDYFYNTAGTQATDQGDGRVDYRLSDKDSLFGSISWGNTNKTSVAPFPGALDNSGFSGTGEIDLNRNGQISYTRVWNPTLVTETRASFTRLVTSRVGANPTADLFKQFGIGGYDPTYAYTGNGGLPNINPSGYTGFGGAQWGPTKEFNNVLDFVQNVAISKGSHALKLGAEYRNVKFPFFQVPAPHGIVNYNGNETAFPSIQKSSLGSTVGASTGDSVASALLGQVDSSSISTANFISSQKVAWAGYIQDDWKFSRKLTLNLGVRYELWSPIGERFGRQASFDLQTLTLYIPKGPQQDLPLPPNFAASFPNVKVDRGSVSNYLVPWDKLDFGPRIGLAYQLNEKTVIRAGYGIFYGGEENQGGSPNRGEGIPFNETVQFNRANGISTFIGTSDPLCTGCLYMPGGLQGGFPASPFTANAQIQFRGVQPDFRNPLVHKWNLIVQRELPWDVALELGYEGNHQAHQVILGNTDTYPNLPTTNSSFTSDSTRYINSACSTCQSVGNGLSETVSNGFGNYAAGSAKLEKRFSRGLQFLTAYTWSHALANSGTPLSGSSNTGYLDPTNWGSGYSSAGWDIRHSLTSGFQYELPFGKGKPYAGNMNRAADILVGGWHANGVLTLRTGVAYGLAGTSCQGVWGRCEPDVVPGYVANQAPAGGRNPNQYFDINAYKVAAPLTGGNLGLQAMTGPPTRTMDFSLFKDFNLTERFKFQFRTEALNLANTPVFPIPDASVSDLKSIGGNGNFGRITSSVTGTERHIQFSLRLQF